MRNQQKYTLLLAILLVVIAVVVGTLIPSREPVYKGKRLSEW